MCWSFILLFLFCEGGEQLTGEYNKLDEALCQCKWYLYPIVMQKMLLIFMPNTQAPMLIQSYGNLVCARNSFKTVKTSNSSLFFEIISSFFYIFVSSDNSWGIFLFHDNSTNISVKSSLFPSLPNTESSERKMKGVQKFSTKHKINWSIEHVQHDVTANGTQKLLKNKRVIERMCRYHLTKSLEICL